MNVFKRLLMLSGGGTSVPYDYPDKFAFFADQAVVEPSVLEVLRPDDRLGDFTVVRASDASYTYSSGVIQIAPDNVARIDYTNGVAELLTEPQSTNLATYSEDFSDASWTKTGVTVTPSAVIDPSGNTNAYLFSGTGALNTNAGGTETSGRSIWVRTVSGTGKIGLLTHNSNTDNIFDITEQWQRFEINTSNATGVANLYAVDNRAIANTLTEVLIWGAQLEALPYATSYIPTNGSTITRLQDQITSGGNVNVINSEEGTMFFEGSALDHNAANMHITLSDSSLSNRIDLWYATNSRIYARAYVNDVNTFFIYDTSDMTINNKIAIKWKENDFAMWVNGVEIGINLIFSSYPIDTLFNASFNDGRLIDSELFFGRTRELLVYNRALTDEELQSITEL